MARMKIRYLMVKNFSFVSPSLRGAVSFACVVLMLLQFAFAQESNSTYEVQQQRNYTETTNETNDSPFNVTGEVRSHTGDPLGNIEVVVKKGIVDVAKFKTEKDGTFTYSFLEVGFFTLIFQGKNLPTKIVLLNIDGVTPPPTQSVVLSETTRLQAVVIKNRSGIRRAEKQALGVTVIDENALQNSAISDTGDLSGSAGNLHALDTGSSISMYFALRGITSVNSVDPLIVFYIDDVAQFQTSSTPLQLVNLQSIQVLKGSQSTTYGRNAFAGVIDIKTKKQPNRVSGNASVELSSILAHSYMLNIAFPILKRYIYGKLGGYFSTSDGAVWNETLGERSDGYLNFNVYAGFDFYPSDFLQFSLTGKYEASEEEPFPYVGGGLTFEENARLAFAHPYNINHDTKNANERHIGEAINKFNFTSDYFNLISTLTYQNFLNKLTLDTDFSSDNSSKVAISSGSHLVTEELKFTSSFETEKYFTWQVGSYFYFQQQETETEITLKEGLSFDQQFDSSALHAWQRNIGIAFLANFVFPVHERIALIVGGRVDLDMKWARIRKSNIKNSEEVLSTSFEKDRLDYFLTPKLAANFSLDDKISAYISLTRGYRNGGLNNFVNLEENIFFDAESSWQSEVGVKVRNDNLRFDFAFFYTYWENQQVNVFFEGDFFQFGLVNAERSQSFGAEWETKVPLFFGLSYESTIGFANSSFLGLTSQTGRSLKGKKQPFVPETTMLNALQHSYDVQIGKVGITHTNRIEHKYTAAIFYNPENTILGKGYHLLNFTSTLRIYNVTLSFWIKNLLNEKYIGFSLPFGGITPVRLADPFRFGGKISVYF